MPKAIELTIDPTLFVGEEIKKLQLQSDLLKELFSKNKKLLANKTHYVTLEDKSYQVRLAYDITPWVNKKGERQYLLNTKKIGEGGQGEVYELGKLIPNKDSYEFLSNTRFSKSHNIYKAESLPRDEEERKDFIDKRKAILARAKHLHVKGPVEHVDLNGVDYTLYTIMRKFEKAPLYKVFADSRFTTALRLELAIKLLHTLKEQIFDQDFIHRDIKPDNIIVDIDFANQKVKAINIIDFDYAKLKERDDKNETPGTDGYRSPEIIKSKKGSNEATDLYSMGRVLLKLFSFDRDLDIASSISSLLKKITDQNINSWEKTDEERKALVTNTIKEMEDIAFDYYKKSSAQKEVEPAYRAGRIVTQELNKNEKNFERTRSEEYLRNITNIIHANTKNLNDKESVATFIKTVGIKAFENLNSAKAIQEKTIKITDTFAKERNALSKMYPNPSKEVTYLLGKLPKITTLDAMELFHTVYQQTIDGKKDNVNESSKVTSINNLQEQLFNKIADVKSIDDAYSLFNNIEKDHFKDLQNKNTFNLFKSPSPWDKVIIKLKEKLYGLVEEKGFNNLNKNEILHCKEIFLQKSGGNEMAKDFDKQLSKVQLL